MFGFAQVASAGVALLSNAEMDGINAGEWVVVDKEGKKVVDVYFSANDLKLKDQSQTELMAVNNTNAVDSAVATQTNAAMTCGDATVNEKVGQHNTAEILNHNPSQGGSWYNNVDSCEFSVRSSSSECSSESLCAGYMSSSSSSAGGSSLDYDETLDAFALGIAHAEGEGGCLLGDFEACAAGVAVVDYDKHINRTTRRSSSSSCEAGFICGESRSRSQSRLGMRSSKESSEMGGECRKNLSEDNKLVLKDRSQKNLMAVSNLNAVGSGAAMQTNIAYNVGGIGVYSQTNTATVVNGL